MENPPVYWDRQAKDPIDPKKGPATRLLIRFLSEHHPEIPYSKLEKLAIARAFAWLIEKGIVRE